MRVLATLLCALLLGGCAINIAENHFFYPGAPERPVAIANGEWVDIATADGTKLRGAYVTQPDARVDVLYFGGNVSRVDDYGATLARHITPLGANLLMVDYRGYGRSEGTPTIDALKVDALAAFDWLRNRVGNRPIVVHGMSLGSFMAAHVAANRPVNGVVLESSAPDVRQWANNQVPLVAKPFLRLRIAPSLLKESNAAALQKSTAPLLLLTGSRDPITPPKFAHALLKASAATEKRVFIVPGATHGDAIDSKAAQDEYGKFLRVVSGQL